MNSFEPIFLEEAARRDRSSASTEIGLEGASAWHGIQANSSGVCNKIKAIAAANKYFLTISSQELGSDERCEPSEWLH
jgi:hypothetical protein